MTRTLQVLDGSYVDSVTLMQVSKTIGSLPGVSSALVAMATELNLELAAGMGFAPTGKTTPNQMLVAIDASSEEAVAAAMEQVGVALKAASTPTSAGFGTPPRPLTVAAASRAADASVALISTPGQHAFADAVDAIDSGLHTMVFSDNMPVEQEVALKEYADAAGVVVMGPDCGTAVIGGVGLGFANVVRPGPVGIVAASGTGAQHLMSLLDGAGIGISHCVGVGGRDLSEQVGGRSTLRAMDLLDADETTQVIVVISKPPAPSVAQVVHDHARSLGTPVRFGLLGKGQPDLTATARATVEALGRQWAPPQRWDGVVPSARPGGHLRGLFVGGTLCDEAMLLAADRLGPVHSNIPLQPDWALSDDLASVGHTMIDFGDDRLTQGRPHPMIDGSIRAGRILREVDDRGAGVILLDVVLGLGAHPDPAAELGAGLERAASAGVPVVVSLVGTRDDPQELPRQAKALTAAGAWVFASNAEATLTALQLLGASGGASR